MTDSNENSKLESSRHGCLTAWLVLMIVANSIGAIQYLFFSEWLIKNLHKEISQSVLVIYAISGLANVVFSISILKWKKWGFWGFILTSILGLFLNLNIGLSIVQSIFGLVGAVILFGLLHLKKDGKEAWKNLS